MCSEHPPVTPLEEPESFYLICSHVHNPADVGRCELAKPGAVEPLDRPGLLLCSRRLNDHYEDELEFVHVVHVKRLLPN